MTTPGFPASKKLRAQLNSIDNPLDPEGSRNRRATWLLYHQRREEFIRSLGTSGLNKQERMSEIINFDSKYRRLW